MISYHDCDPILSWEGLVEAIQLGHKRNKAEISDTFLYRKMILFFPDQLG